MKKYFPIILVIFVLTVVASGTTVAQSTRKSAQKQNSTQGRYYIDKNNDGVCDNYSPRQASQGRNYSDRNNDGVCDNRSSTSVKKNSAAPNFKDANNDGICDNKFQTGCRRGAGKGRGCGRYGYHGGR